MSAHSGALGGGTTVTVYGRHLRTTRRVTLASGASTFKVVSDREVRVRIPRSVRSLVTHVYLSTAHGRTSADSHSQWTYVSAPTVSRLSVGAGPTVGGTRVTLSGHNLQSVRTVSFGASPARIVAQAAPTTVTVVAPLHTAGSVYVWVSTAYGTSRATPRFTYALPPSLAEQTFVSQAGGPVSIRGANLGAVRGVVVDGRAANVLGTVSGSSVSFSAPAHAPGLASVVVTTAGGTATAQLLYESVAPVTVTSARDIDTNHAGITGLSCPSTTFCLAIDDADAVTFDGTRWSSPSPTGRIGLTNLSCASANFCVAIGDAGGAIYNGSSWTPTDPGTDEPMGISCPADGQCVAAGSSNTAVFDGGVWRLLDVRSKTEEDGISCLRLTFCTGAGVYDDSQEWFDGSAWTETSNTAADGTAVRNLADLSCTSETDCSAIDAYGKLWKFHNGTWSVSRSVAQPGMYWRSISCGSPQFCVVSDSLSTAVTSEAGAPNSSVTFERPVQASGRQRLRVSCATATFCVAASYWGAVSQWDGTAWSTPVNILEPVGYLTSVACASNTECFAAGGFGTVVPYNGTSWGEPVSVDPLRLGRTIVSCATSGLCATISEPGDVRADVGNGTAAVLVGGTWRATRGVLDNALAISCGGSRCMAVSATQYSTYDAASAAPAWSPAASLPSAGMPPGGNAVSVACTAATDCVVTYGSGYSHFDGQAWSAVTRISQLVGTGLVACAAAGPCLARNSGFSVLRSASGSWGSPLRTAADGSGGDVVEACGGSTCLSLSRAGFQVYSAGTWTVEQDIPALFPYFVGAACMPDGQCLLVRSDGTVYHVTPPPGG